MGGGGGGGSDPLRRAVGKREWIIERQISRAFWLSVARGHEERENFRLHVVLFGSELISSVAWAANSENIEGRAGNAPCVI